MGAVFCQHGNESSLIGKNGCRVDFQNRIELLFLSTRQGEGVRLDVRLENGDEELSPEAVERISVIPDLCKVCKDLH